MVISKNILRVLQNILKGPVPLGWGLNGAPAFPWASEAEVSDAH